jgi:hypothetical protein
MFRRGDRVKCSRGAGLSARGVLRESWTHGRLCINYWRMLLDRNAESWIVSEDEIEHESTLVALARIQEISCES